MKRALIGLTALGFGLALSLISAPPRADADTNGICMVGPQPVAGYDGIPVFPECTADRRLQVQVIPDPSNPPTQVQVISLPSSAPINGSVTVTNTRDFPTPIPFPTSYSINNFPSTQNVQVLNPGAFPSPIPFPANQNVTVLNPPSPYPSFPASFAVNNISTFPTPIPFPAVQTVNVNNFPTPSPAATQSVTQVPANITYLTTAGTTLINSGATTFYGAFNISTSAQITAVTCYNALTATGQPFLSTALGLTNPWFPGVGISLGTGLTCNVPVTLLGNGVGVLWKRT